MGFFAARYFGSLLVFLLAGPPSAPSLWGGAGEGWEFGNRSSCVGGNRTAARSLDVEEAKGEPEACVGGWWMDANVME